MGAVLEYDHTVFDANQEEADKNLLVKFYPLAIQNETRSVEEGRPIFDDVEMIEIRVRGTKENVVVRPVREDDKRRFRAAWRAHKENSAELESGTPLKQWPILTPSQVEELKYIGFTTVEQVAEANDGVVSRIMGLQSLKNKAKAFIEFSKGAAPIERMQKDLDERDNLIATMQSQMADLQKRMAEMEAQSPEKKAPLPTALAAAKRS